MLVVAENINIRRTKLGKAMKERNSEPIIEVAKSLKDSGANYLDINIGPGTKGGPELMEWLVTTIQKEVEIPLCLDTKNIEAIKAGLEVHKGKAIINSTDGTQEQMNKLMPLAKEYNAAIIGLTLNESGIPRDADERFQIAFNLVTKAMEFGVSPEDLYIDSIILPVSGMQDQVNYAIESMEMFSQLSDPPPNTIVGLSNVSQSSPDELRSLLNRICLIMLICGGLSAAIMDPLDKELMAALKTYDILTNKVLYAHSYLD
ncbi:5-methyltetrahydrofolate:corrinoid/iron-sulfur protein co-methyltransferase [subsurface metagenome]